MININFETMTNVIKTLVEHTFESVQSSKAELLTVANVCLEKKNQILSYSNQELLDMGKESLLIFLKMTAAVTITILSGIEAVKTAIELQTFITVIAGFCLFSLITMFSNILFIVYGYPLIVWVYKQFKSSIENNEEFTAVQLEVTVQPTTEINIETPEEIKSNHAPAITALELFQSPILIHTSNNKIKNFANSFQKDELLAIADFLNDSNQSQVIEFDANTSRRHLVSKFSKHLLKVKAEREQLFLEEFPRS